MYSTWVEEAESGVTGVQELQNDPRIQVIPRIVATIWHADSSLDFLNLAVVLALELQYSNTPELQYS
jgi:hypothetical protein